MDSVTFLNPSLSLETGNMNCKPASPQVIGPILDQDEVIIGVVGPFGKSFLPLVPASLGLGLGTIFTYGESSDIRPNPNKNLINSSIPKFTINYLSPDQSTSGADHPIVFFTTKNGSTAQGSCRRGPSNEPCTGLVRVSGGTPPGIGVAPITPCSTCAMNNATSSNRYLVPGSPTPIQLIPVNGEGSWFPQTYPLPPAEGTKFVTALSNVAYTMNAVVGGKSYNNISISAFFDNPQNPQNGAYLWNTEPQQIYIIPTKYFTSKRGADSASLSCPDCADNTDSGLGAFCSIACRAQFKNGNELLAEATGYCCDPQKCSSLGGANNCVSCQYGFTQKEECTDGCFYRYCKAGEPRCTGDCKRPCSPTGTFKIVDKICVLDDGAYSCQIPGRGDGSDELGAVESQSEVISSTEIAIVALVGATILGLIIYVIYIWADKYNQS